MGINFTLNAKGYLEGLANGDKKTIQLIHHHYFEKILHFIELNQGTKEDAKDVFQEALMVIYVKTKSDHLTELSCSFYTFLYSICKNIWLNKIRSLRKQNELNEETLDFTNEVAEAIEKKEQWDLYREKFKNLNSDCQNLLMMYFKKINFNEISDAMGLSSGNYAKKKKCLCKQKLMDMIRSDHRYIEIKND